MSLVKALVGIMVAVLIGIGVTVPVVVTTVSGANLTGTDAVMAGFLSTLIIVAIIMGIVALFA